MPPPGTSKLCVDEWTLGKKPYNDARHVQSLVVCAKAGADDSASAKTAQRTGTYLMKLLTSDVRKSATVRRAPRRAGALCGVGRDGAIDRHLVLRPADEQMSVAVG